MSGLFSLIGQGVSSVLGLDGSVANAVLGAQRLFSGTLDAVSALNPFRAPSTPPGTRAEQVEQQLVRLETLLARKNGVLENSLDENILLQEKLCGLRQLLAKSTLLEDEQLSIFGMAAAFLSNRDVAERLNKPMPDQGLFLENLQRRLAEDYHLPAPEVRQLVQEIGQLTSELKWAA